MMVSVQHPRKTAIIFRFPPTNQSRTHILTVNTDWQHDFVPADNHRMSGTSFYLYRPPFASVGNAGFAEVLNVFAYNDNTDITVLDITAAAKTTSGLTTVKTDKAAVVASTFSTTLNTGQDLLEAKS